MAYPSLISVLANPAPTDRLNSPSHSTLHDNENAGITEIQTFVGTLPSSAVGTLIYDIRSPDSNGGGHVQAANKGGTGQTSFSKGDLVVATSSSVLAKLAVSSVTGYTLMADTNEAAGMKWAPDATNKVAINLNSVWGASGTTSSVLYSASIAAGTLGTNGAIRFTGTLNNLSMGDDLSVAVLYGNNVIADTTITVSPSSIVGTKGTIEGIIASRGSTSSQLGQFTVNTAGQGIWPGTAVGKMMVRQFASGSSSVNSGVQQNLVITSSFVSAATRNSVLTGIFVVEKIT